MTTERGSLTTPVAILGSGALIAAALFFALNSGGTTPTNDPYVQPTANPVSEVQADDHIIGNPDATVVLIEYSDTECPFCKNHHQVLKQMTEEYDPSDFAWVYRNLPLTSLHSKAQKQAEALECAAELAGNDGFWNYANRLYDLTPSNNGLDMTLLPEIAEFAGLDVDDFTECLDSGSMAERVNEDAAEVPGVGTPHNILIVNGEQFPLAGGQSPEGMRQIINQLLDN
ncbi:disulfide bond formation protein DsbA [Candidatus Kaiserbacteria bacterium]|nr:MAG: disulfide bond formation protein DsbA [Candidatus Kaiserbacteria bacterium]